MKIFYTKKDRQIIEGLSILEAALEVRADYAEQNMDRADLTSEERAYYKAMYKQHTYMQDQIQDILNGKLHF
mgnify:CR=1 FL=1